MTNCIGERWWRCTDCYTEYSRNSDMKNHCHMCGGDLTKEKVIVIPEKDFLDWIESISLEGAKEIMREVFIPAEGTKGGE